MSDFADRADAANAIYLEAALRNLSTQHEAKFTGCCLFCGTPLKHFLVPERWCNAECRDDWQHEQNARRRFGK